jgi:hypothetical protein
MSGPFGGGNDVTIGIKTTSDPSGANNAVQSLNALTAELNKQTTAMNTLRAASAAMGSEAAKQGAQLLKNAQSADEYSARLKNLQAETARVEASHKSATGVAKDFDNMMKSMSTQVIGLITGYVGLQAILGMLSGAWNSVTGAIESAVQAGAQFLEQSFQLADASQRMEYLWQYQYGGPQGGGPQIAAQTAAWLPNFAMKSPFTLQEIMGAVGPLSQLNLSFQGLQRYLPLISDLASTHTSIFGGGGPLPISYAALAVMEATKGYSRRLLMELQIRPNELEKYGLKFVGDKESGQLANPEMFLPALEAYSKDKGYTGASAKMATQTIWGLGASLTDRLQSFQRRAMGENIPDPNAGALSKSVLDMIKKGDITGAMSAVGADQASMKSFGVTFNKSGGVSDAAGFQDALQQFSQALFYQNAAGILPQRVIDEIQRGDIHRAMMEVGAGRGELEKKYGVKFTDSGGLAKGFTLDQFQTALQQFSTDQHPQFKKGSIFDVILGGMKDFSTWWDEHQSTFDKISKFVGDVGGKLLTVGRNSVSSVADGFIAGFGKAFTGGDTFKRLGNDFLSWITDPKNQDMLKEGAKWLGTNLGQALTLVAQDLDKLRAAWDNIPDDWKKNGANLLGGAIWVAATNMQILLINVGRFFDTIRGLGDWFKEHNFWSVWSEELLKINKLMQAAGELMVDIRLLIEGKADPSSILDAIGKINARIGALFDAAAKADYTPAQGHGKGGSNYDNIHRNPGESVRLGANVTQTNTFNIQGATSLDIQRVIDKTGRDLNYRRTALSSTPGGLQYNVVGLF